MSKVTLTAKIKHFSESAMLRGVRTVHRLCIIYLDFALQLREKSTEKLPQQGSRNCQLGAIHYANFATFWKVVPTSLSIPISPRMPDRYGSNLTHRMYLLRCRNNGFPTPANFKSNPLVRHLMWSTIKETPKSSWIWHRNLPSCSHSNAKTLGFKHLQFPDMGASGGPTDRARVVHYFTGELLIQYDSVSDGEAILPVYEMPQHFWSLSTRSAVYQGFPQISGRIATMDCLPEEINWPWLRDEPSGFRGQHRGALRDVDSDMIFHSLQHPFRWLRYASR
jgi:hypothetical protein